MKIKPMFTVILPLILALVLTDCEAQPSKYPDSGRWYEGRMPANVKKCPDERPIRGSSFVFVRYADSSLDVTSNTSVGMRNEGGVGAIEFILIPTGISEEATVTITGTSGPTGADPSWLNGEGQVSLQELRRISIVVCPNDDTPVGTYKYEVRVEGVGTLDPRAEVIE